MNIEQTKKKKKKCFDRKMKLNGFHFAIVKEIDVKLREKEENVWKE